MADQIDAESTIDQSNQETYDRAVRFFDMLKSPNALITSLTLEFENRVERVEFDQPSTPDQVINHIRQRFSKPSEGKVRALEVNLKIES
jgi:hypothetical protein